MYSTPQILLIYLHIVSVQFYLGSCSGAVSYKIKWRKIGGPVNVDFTPTNLLSLSNLSQSSNYKWRVRSECDNFLQMFQHSIHASNTLLHYLLSGISSGRLDLFNNLNIYPNPIEVSLIYHLSQKK